MSAEHVRQSRLLALAARLQRRKEQLERDWKLVQKEHRCGAASLILEARSAVQKAERALDDDCRRMATIECSECGSMHIAEYYDGGDCRGCGAPLPARAAA